MKTFLYEYTPTTKKVVESRQPMSLISCFKATFMRVRLGSQGVLIMPLPQIRAFEADRNRPLVFARLAI